MGWPRRRFRHRPGFTGKIRGHTLDRSAARPSASVECRKQGDKAEIYVKSWADGDASPKVMTSDRANHTYVRVQGGGPVGGVRSRTRCGRPAG